MSVFRACSAYQKWCSYCKTFKDKSEFSKAPNKKSGLHGYCKKCRVDYARDKVTRDRSRAAMMLESLEVLRTFIVAEHMKGLTIPDDVRVNLIRVDEWLEEKK